ncbi:MAG: hypothetical protein ACFCUX_06025 [Candidatus Methylacidiphilales bacterium]
MRYLNESVLCKHTPLQLGLPWISHQAIDFLNDYLNPNHEVAEWGGGVSTLYFAARTRNVTCIESDKQWMFQISTEAERCGYKNIRLRLHPFDAHDARAFMTSDYLLSIRDQVFDVILIDGFEQDVPLRTLCFHVAEAQIRKGGIIIVDDSSRYPVLRTQHHARYVRTLRSTGPCRLGITSTDIFFY